MLTPLRQSWTRKPSGSSSASSPRTTSRTRGASRRYPRSSTGASAAVAAGVAGGLEVLEQLLVDVAEHVAVARGVEVVGQRVEGEVARGAALQQVRSAVEYVIGRGDRMVIGDISLTPRAKTHNYLNMVVAQNESTRAVSDAWPILLDEAVGLALQLRAVLTRLAA